MPMSSGSGSHATPQPQPSQICTRAHKELERVPTYKELMKLNKDLVATAVQAREYLEKEGYTSPDARGGRAKLSYMLLLLLHAVPLSVLPKGIRAVAALLEREEAGCTADVIAAAVLHKIDLVLNSIGKAAKQTQGAASDTRLVADCIYRTGEETRDELQKGLGEATEDIQKAMVHLKDEVSKMNVAAVPATSRMGSAEG